MTVSDYLKIQAQLLITVDAFRCLPLLEFIDQAPAPFSGGVDMAEMARCALALVETGPHGKRKHAGRENGLVVRKEGAA